MDNVTTTGEHHFGAGETTDTLIIGLNAFLMVFHLVTMFASAGVLLYYRNTPIVRARSPFLMIGLFITLLAVNGEQTALGTVTYPVSCILETWLDAMFDGPLFWIFLLLAYRLLLIFNLAKEKFRVEERSDSDASSYKPSLRRRGKPAKADSDHQLEVEAEEDLPNVTMVTIGNVTTSIVVTRKGLVKYLMFWCNYEMISEVNLQIMFTCLFFAHMMIPTWYTVFGFATKFDPAVCDQVHLGENMLLGCVGAISGTALAIMLRNAHDAYFLKGELRILGIFCLVIVVPQLGLGLANKIPYFWFEFIGLFEFVFMGFVFFTIPAILAIYYARTSDASTSSGVSGTDFGSHSAKEEEEMAESSTFSSKKIQKILNDPLGFTFIEEYCVHYQLFELTSCLSFWQKVNSFKKIVDKRALAGHASIIYQKYLKPHAYIQVDLFTPSQLAPIEAVINDMMSSEEGKDVTVEPTLFDDLSRIVEETLFDQMFKTFYKSRYYSDYKQKVSLGEGIRQIKGPQSKQV